MATTGRFGKFAIVFAMVLLIFTGIAGLSHGTGFIVGQYPIALDVVTPKDKSAFKAGTKTTEPITITVGRK
jgi:hypothetical protein